MVEPSGHETDRALIIGAGQAGSQCADSLRQNGYRGAITILGDEPHLPYQRPPLSKAYLLEHMDAERLHFRSGTYLAENAIAVETGTHVDAIDRTAKTVRTHDGRTIGYDTLVIATGARVRPLDVPGADLKGVFYLRTLDDAERIKVALARASRVAIIGAGFIGLEFAAVARTLGKEVTVLEAENRVLARALAPVLSDFFEKTHTERGVTIRTATTVRAFIGAGGQLASVRCETNEDIPVDMAVIGIGIRPNVELAAAAGLACDNGIVVDAYGRTTDPHIYAAGDCTSTVHPSAGALIRLESVQNAIDQARAVAASICGLNKPYDAVPWFWSDQYDLKLQMAGLAAGCDVTALRGSMDENRFSVFHFRDGHLRAVDSVNRPADHMLARRLIAAGLSPTPQQAADPDFALKSLLT